LPVKQKSRPMAALFSSMLTTLANKKAAQGRLFYFNAFDAR
jgi:hypothetical protein